MKVDFNQIKTTISLPDFLLELGWKIVEGSSNSCPKMSNGTHTIVIKRNSQNNILIGTCIATACVATVSWI